MKPIKLILAKDRITDDILGVVPHGYDDRQERDLVNRISDYYGFECESVVMSEVLDIVG
jgi:hypothetical protein